MQETLKFFCNRTPSAAETAAIQQIGRAFLRKRLFLVLASSPRTGYIQGRFPAAQYGVSHFVQSVTTFATRTPLPPSISLRSLRTSFAPPHLRVRFARASRTVVLFAFGELRNSARCACFITAFHSLRSLRLKNISKEAQ